MKESQSKILREVTPSAYYCGIGACPCIFETNDNSYVIVGKKLTKRQIEKIDNRISRDEVAIEIPRGLLRDL